MKTNVGATDKLIRIVVGILLIVWGIFGSKIWVIIGLIPLITGLIGYCPLYTVLGINTCKTKTQ
ncbi:MAG: DUF2892 domain-containing protein [candidate division KSB1 bacterium]|nr:DUF2892 domain-containing protein [candidate division KSB1 bacterium]MDZ7376529.1 DUF2892 domain-containing protein [candidate division KSB1 bacterium]MDZ7401596.1 DUF2892 domain-containing protein [candidate division KSB1 bacterium]